MSGGPRLVDPLAVAIAAVAALALVLVSVPWLQALLGAAAIVAFRLVLGRVSRPVRRPLAASVPADGRFGTLTRRELEVAVFVARGMTNREIAELLVLSERTIDNHVQHVMDKLGAHRRSEIAAWVAARGLTKEPTQP